MGVIYCLTSPSGKKYIGQTRRSFEKRLREHSKCNTGCVILNNAIRKYGIDTFECEVLLEINDEHLNKYESMFIDLLNTLEPHGYNIRTGGVYNSTHSSESCDRMRLAKLGENNHNYGKPRSDVVKAKISSAKSGINHHFYGKTLSDEHRAKLSSSFKKYDKTLPMYVAYVKERPSAYQSAGYVVKNHPTLPTRYFTTKTKTLEEKLLQATEYLLTGNGCSSETKC